MTNLKLRALKRFPYANRALRPGIEFEARSSTDAKILIRSKLAVPARAAPSAKTAPIQNSSSASASVAPAAVTAQKPSTVAPAGRKTSGQSQK